MTSNNSFKAPRIRAFKESPIRTRRGLWPLADGLLASNVIGGFGRGLMWFLSLFFAFVLVSGAQKVAQNQLPLSALIRFVALQTPHLVVFIIPASLLFGTVSTFSEMSSRGEITALMASGMSLKRMLRAPLCFVVVLALVTFWLQEVVAPRCELRRGELATAMSQKPDATQIFSHIDKDDKGRVERIIEADAFDAQTLSLVNPDVHFYGTDGSALHITAHSARWNQKQREWVFVQGNIASEAAWKGSKAELDGFQIRHFDKRSFREAMPPDPATLTRLESNLNAQLDQHNFEMASLVQLRFYRDQLLSQRRQSQRAGTLNGDKAGVFQSQIRAATFGIHDKLATPLTVLAIVFIGAPLGVRPQRSESKGVALGLSLMVLLGFYLVWTLTTQWGRGGGGQPVVAAYLPFTVLATTGTFLMWKKN